MTARSDVVTRIAALMTETFPTDPHDLGLAIRARFHDATALEITQAGVIAEQLIRLDHEHADQIGGAVLATSLAKRGLT